MRFTHILLVLPVDRKNVTRAIYLTSLSSWFSKTCKTTDSFNSLVQKEHLGVLWLNPCSKHLYAWSSFKYVQEWKFNNVSEQAVLILVKQTDKHTALLISHATTCVCCLTDLPCVSLWIIFFHFLHVCQSGNWNCTRGGLDLTLRKIYWLKGLPGIGPSCPGKCWSRHP